VSSFSTFIDIGWPGIVTLGCVIVILSQLDPRFWWARAFAIGVSMVLSARYLFWRVTETLPSQALDVSYPLGVVFLCIEATAVLAGMISVFLLVRTTNRTPEVDARLAARPPQKAWPRVDVLICTYNEEEAILERTIVGALGQDYPGLRVWVLDDGRRSWLEELCRRLECGYITRSDNAHAKAGNINNALRHLAGLPDKPDFVSILDADFVPTPRFLKRALSLMDDDVAVVQTPQHFVNPDPIQLNLSAAAVWPDEQRYFFDVVMPSLDGWNQAFCCGTSSVIRYEALMGIGGFPTDSVTEDYLVTLRMKEAGLRTVYLNEPLTFGLAPEGLKEYITQRGRWCLGFMQIFRGRSGPFSRQTTLGLADRAMLVLTFVNWAAVYAVKPFAFIVPSSFLLFGVVAVHADVWEMSSHFLPYFVWNAATLTWLAKGRWMVVMSEVCQLIAAPTVLKAVVVGTLKPKGHKFKVTAKGGDRSRGFVQWSMLSTYLALLAFTFVAIAWGFLVEFQYQQPKYAAMALFWSWYNAMLLVVTCIVCIEKPRRRLAERFRTSDRVVCMAPDGDRTFTLKDISIGGASVSGLAPGPVGSTCQWRFGSNEIEATVVRILPDGFSLRFDDSLATRAKMIRHFYAGAYIKPLEQVRPALLARALAARLLG
jgi:cellulose synthase (UDP-forming)